MSFIRFIQSKAVPPPYAVREGADMTASLEQDLQVQEVAGTVGMIGWGYVAWTVLRPRVPF